ncbi:1,4-dihydroxy-2-naphthoate polyprenyltransferase [Haloechinothrix sp. YIM 98757]|uniref:1,4-dihydroxy-2-naphthoate octaprenyltransferase n=1 Tax=Haloechinothrix aidingensis TaxID=2752311 RepID=A0A837ZWV3_9PSEU|nr:1,4-dihydroxy-2-naphthoate polyprenyltransferase [Haloechinothrix aidingensis]MBA0124624.1 1,4-dihydroxy-2-naphthoate polyprenyltransferase [Haloechinothrix aidingensis]
MATIAEWIEGARPRTLPNAIAPVLAGTGAAAYAGDASPAYAALALIVALALIIGVNFANDYSDGIRGTDDRRVGPVRLVATGLAAPTSVRATALSSLVVACIVGATLVVLSGHLWLFAVGAACVAGAWFYTGSAKPYGYAGFGEPAVFVFFGLVAVLGTMYVQAGTVSPTAVACAVAIGALSAAVLLANNLRDIRSDSAVGKRTLAVRLGDAGTRRLYVALLVLPFVASLLVGTWHPPATFAVVSALLLIAPLRTVLGRHTGHALVPVLRDTGLAMLLWAAVTATALAFG